MDCSTAIAPNPIGFDSFFTPRKPSMEEQDEKVSARRMQNRISQREFRSRKQAHIKELEAKVQVMSGSSVINSQCDTVYHIRSSLEMFKNDNKRLRALIGEVTQYCDSNPEHLDRVLAHFNLTRQTLHELLSKNESAVGLEAWESSRAENLTPELSPNITTSPPVQQIPSDFNSQAFPTELPSQMFAMDHRLAQSFGSGSDRYKIHGANLVPKIKTPEKKKSWPIVDADSAIDSIKWEGIVWNDFQQDGIDAFGYAGPT